MSDAGTNEKVNEQLQKIKKQIESTRRMLSLIKQLSEIQISKAVVSTKIFATQQIPMATEKMKRDIREKAKPYGKKAEAIAESYINNKQKEGNIIQQYKESLEAIEKEYQETVKYAVTQRRKLEEAEQESAAKEMNLRQDRQKIAASPEYTAHLIKEDEALTLLDEALKQNDMNVILTRKDEYDAIKKQNPITKYSQVIRDEKERRQKIQDLLTMCDDGLVKCEEERTNMINEATSDKNNKLAVIEKQPIMKRILGSIFDRINGTKKFTKDVIEKVQETNYYINDEVLPSVKERMSEGIDQVIDAINEKGRPLVERGIGRTKQVGRQVLHKTRASGIKIWEGTRETRTKAWEKAKETGRKTWYKTKETGTKVLDKTKETGIQFAQEAKEDWDYIKEAKEQMMQKLEARLIEAIESEKELNTERSLAYAKIKKSKREQHPMAYDDSVYEETDR